jgi:hypothetical protein
VSTDGIIHISYGGSVQTIEAGGREWRFEMHPYCGPVIVHKRTEEILKNQPGPRSPFWDAVEAWDKQGRQVKDGRCVYTKARTA